MGASSACNSDYQGVWQGGFPLPAAGAEPSFVKARRRRVLGSDPGLARPEALLPPLPAVDLPLLIF
jgi:hypothetical protein